MPLTAIVVEDERLPRLALLQKLEEHKQDIKVIADCESYDSALQSILHHRPDVLFLDIQLHGRDSIALLEELRQTITLPHVIFTTAYADRRYLMSAIKLDAVDYLLKPIDKNELALAIAKIIHHEQQRQPATADEQRLSFRTANGKTIVHPDDIAYFQADGNYARLITFYDTEDIFESLAVLSRRLDPAVFVRTDRSTIVNVQRIMKLNTHRRVCILRSPEGTIIQLELSKSSIDCLLNVLP